MQTDPTDEVRGIGVTYFIQAQKGGPVKIGRSQSAKGAQARLAECQTGSPHQLVIRRLLQGAGHERELHVRFAHLRLMGEWFDLDDELATIAGASRDSQPARSRILAERLAFHRGFRRGVEHAFAKVDERLTALRGEIRDDREDADHYMLVSGGRAWRDDRRRILVHGETNEDREAAA